MKSLTRLIISQLQPLLAHQQPFPPLFCIPILVKDNYDTSGMAAAAGSVGLLDNIATANAFVVRGLHSWAFTPYWQGSTTDLG